MNTVIKELNKKEMRQASGGVYEDIPHCPKCQSRVLIPVGPMDIGTLPCFRCKNCDYEWMMAL